MSKKPLLEENVARRWAKYAGIQKDAENFLSEAYNMPMEEEVVEEKAAPKITDVVRPGGKEAKLAGMPMEEADVLEELEGLLEQDIDVEDEGDEEDEDIDVEDEVEMDAEVSMSQEDVEAALKAGLEAMASAIGDALKIKIDVRSGGEEEVEAEEELDVDVDVEEEEIMEEGEHGESKGDKGKDKKDPEAKDYEDGGDRQGDEGAGKHKDEKDYEDGGDRQGDKSKTHAGKDYQKESIDRDALVEKVMKRVAARLVKEAKEAKK